MPSAYDELLDLAARGDEFGLCQPGCTLAVASPVVGRGYVLKRKIKVGDIHGQAELDADVVMQVVRMPAAGDVQGLVVGVSLAWRTLDQSLHISSMGCSISVDVAPLLSLPVSPDVNETLPDDLADLIRTESDGPRLDPFYERAREFGATWLQTYPGCELARSDARIPAYHAQTVRAARKRAPAVLGMLAPVLDVGVITARDLERLRDWLKQQSELAGAIAA